MRASQPQEEHFHTAGRGMVRPEHNSAGQLCTLPAVAKVLPLYSTGQQTPAVSIQRKPVYSTYQSKYAKLNLYSLQLTTVALAKKKNEKPQKEPQRRDVSL